MNSKEIFRINQLRPTGMRLLMTMLLFSSLSFISSQAYGSSHEQLLVRLDHEQAIRIAGQSVDQAWKTFHQAALGGTLASPALQTRIEYNLHEARGLLLQVRQALGRGDLKKVDRAIERLSTLTSEAIQLSQEKKQ